MTKNKGATRFFSQQQESNVAKALNGRRTSDSGAGKWSKR